MIYSKNQRCQKSVTYHSPEGSAETDTTLHIYFHWKLILICAYIIEISNKRHLVSFPLRRSSLQPGEDDEWVDGSGCVWNSLLFSGGMLLWNSECALLCRTPEMAN